MAIVQKYRKVSCYVSGKFLKNVAQIEIVQMNRKYPLKTVIS
jgi:hypothetical protein